VDGHIGSSVKYRGLDLLHEDPLSPHFIQRGDLVAVSGGLHNYRFEGDAGESGGQ
jgi:hypothetical protein